MDKHFESINELAKSIYKDNKKKGFWDKERNFGELLMLVVSELGEALEAHRKSNFAHVDYDILYYDDFKSVFEETIKDTVEDEIADSIIRLLDLSHGLGIDIGYHIDKKLQYNKTRSKRHGKEY